MLEECWDLNSQRWQIRFCLPSVGEWIQMKVGQKLEGSRIVSTINSLSSEFSNIWNTPHGGSIKNLLIENKNEDGAPRNMILTNKGKLWCDLRRIQREKCLFHGSQEHDLKFKGSCLKFLVLGLSGESTS